MNPGPASYLWDRLVNVASILLVSAYAVGCGAAIAYCWSTP